MPNPPTSPEDSTTVYTLRTKGLVLRAQIEPPGEVESISWDVNGDGQFEQEHNNRAGLIFNAHPLHPGFNEIALRVFQRGIEQPYTVTKWVYIEEEEADPPVIEMVHPTEGKRTTRRSKYSIQAKVFNLPADDSIRVSLRDEPFHTFSYDRQTGLLDMELPLKKGSNAVHIQAGEADQHLELSFVRNDPPVENRAASPSVTLIVEQQAIKDGEIEVALQTRHVSRDDQIRLLLNGKRVQPIRKRTTGKWVATAALQPGRNAFEVEVSTPGGKDKDVADIAYRPKPPARPALAGMRLERGTPDCILPSSQTSFTVSIRPDQPVILQSFYVQASECGGLDVRLTGPDRSVQSFKAALNKGISQLNFGAIDAMLEGGKEYILSCRPFQGYGSCHATEKPRLVVYVSDPQCPSTPYEGKALEVDQQGAHFLYDLKYLY